MILPLWCGCGQVSERSKVRGEEGDGQGQERTSEPVVLVGLSLLVM